MRRFTLSVVAFSLAAFGLALQAEPVDGEWPRWRGPFDNGVARGDAPTNWGDTQNIKWKVDVPGKGLSSPVIWKDKIFMTTAVSDAPVAPAAESGGPGPGARGKAGGKKGGAKAGRKKGGGGPGGGAGVAQHRFLVLADDRRTGKKLWEQQATETTPHEGYHRQYGSFASNSPVTDGETLITYFGSRGVYAYDLDGKPLWNKDLGDMYKRLQFGEGTAAVLHGDTVLINFDGERDDDFLVALNKNTGEEQWRTDRVDISNWAAPLVLEHAGKKQVVVAAPTKVRSYDFETGKLIWECAGLGANTIPAPVSDGEMVWVMSGYRDPNLLAIKLAGASGDITGTDHVVWTNERGNSYSSSPVLHDGILYFLTDRGMISAFDAKSGEPFYHQQRLPKVYSFKSSLVGANGKLYMASEQGDVVVLKMGKEYEVLATNTMTDEFFVATPAFAGGEIFLRGKSTLYCISEM